VAGPVVRAPNHLGDVVLALPALVEAAAPMVLVVASLAPILRLALPPETVVPFRRGLAGWGEAVRALRRSGRRSGMLLTPSFSAAWMMRCGGVRRLRGTATDGRSPLLSDRIPREALRPHHRINQYRLLLGLGTDRGPVSHRLRPPVALAEQWREALGEGSGAPLVGLFPGANASSRRWPRERFAHLAATLVREGARVVVLGGPGERAVTAAVADGAPGARDLGGRTTMEDLAAVLSVLDVLVTNDTGPMHLAGAVGTRTVSLWGASDPREVRQTGAPDHPVTGAALPCKPCYRNECPRRGRGTLLEDAHRECMRLIATDQVLAATRAALSAGGAA